MVAKVWPPGASAPVTILPSEYNLQADNETSKPSIEIELSRVLAQHAALGDQTRPELVHDQSFNSNGNKEHQLQPSEPAALCSPSGLVTLRQTNAATEVQNLYQVHNICTQIKINETKADFMNSKRKKLKTQAESRSVDNSRTTTPVRKQPSKRWKPVFLNPDLQIDEAAQLNEKTKTWQTQKNQEIRASPKVESQSFVIGSQHQSSETTNAYNWVNSKRLVPSLHTNYTKQKSRFGRKMTAPFISQRIKKLKENSIEPHQKYKQIHLKDLKMSFQQSGISDSKL